MIDETLEESVEESVDEKLEDELGDSLLQEEKLRDKLEDKPHNKLEGKPEEKLEKKMEEKLQIVTKHDGVQLCVTRSSEDSTKAFSGLFEYTSLGGIFTKEEFPSALKSFFKLAISGVNKRVKYQTILKPNSISLILKLDVFGGFWRVFDFELYQGKNSDRAPDFPFPSPSICDSPSRSLSYTESPRGPSGVSRQLSRSILEVPTPDLSLNPHTTTSSLGSHYGTPNAKVVTKPSSSNAYTFSSVDSIPDASTVGRQSSDNITNSPKTRPSTSSTNSPHYKTATAIAVDKPAAPVSPYHAPDSPNIHPKQLPLNRWTSDPGPNSQNKRHHSPSGSQISHYKTAKPDVVGTPNFVRPDTSPTFQPFNEMDNDEIPSIQRSLTAPPNPNYMVPDIQSVDQPEHQHRSSSPHQPVDWENNVRALRSPQNVSQDTSIFSVPESPILRASQNDDVPRLDASKHGSQHTYNGSTKHDGTPTSKHPDSQKQGTDNQDSGFGIVKCCAAVVGIFTGKGETNNHDSFEHRDDSRSFATNVSFSSVRGVASGKKVNLPWDVKRNDSSAGVAEIDGAEMNGVARVNRGVGPDGAVVEFQMATVKCWTPQYADDSSIPAVYNLISDKADSPVFRPVGYVGSQIRKEDIAKTIARHNVDGKCCYLIRDSWSSGTLLHDLPDPDVFVVSYIKDSFKLVHHRIRRKNGLFYSRHRADRRKCETIEEYLKEYLQLPLVPIPSRGDMF